MFMLDTIFQTINLQYETQTNAYAMRLLWLFVSVATGLFYLPEKQRRRQMLMDKTLMDKTLLSLFLCCTTV